MRPHSKTHLFAMFAVFLAGCTGGKIPTSEKAAYIGSEACTTCHEDIYTSFRTTGHPYKLTKVVNGQIPEYPYTELPPNPPNFTYNDVSYVIGGFAWKARFIGLDGYIITQGGQNQYNFETGQWVDYEANEVVPYDCAACHTTGYSDQGHQDGLQGIEGTWAFPGIQCEACHGPGSEHAADPEYVAMVIDRSKELCGECHVRGNPYTIPAKGGFIKHHEQYNELLASKHAFFDCTDCHDPHQSAHYNPDLAIKNDCKACHWDKDVQIAGMENMSCLDCHMPYAAKSAVSSGQYKADVRSHLFSINPDSNAQQFDPTGSFANPYLTLEYTCLYAGCHDTETKGWAAQNAPLVHP